MSEQVTEVTRPRPYFLPDSIDFEALPEAVKAAFDTIIQPTYEELVVAPQSGLERAAGMTIVFLLMEELLDQFDLGQQFDLPNATTRGDRESREGSRSPPAVGRGKADSDQRFATRAKALDAATDHPDRAADVLGG